MCNHSLHSPLVRLRHCTPVRQSGLYSACTGIHLIDVFPRDRISVRRTPAHKPSLTSVTEAEEPPLGMSAVVVLTFDLASDTSTPADEAPLVAASTHDRHTEHELPLTAIEPFEEPPAAVAEPLSSDEAAPATSPSNPAEQPPRQLSGLDRITALIEHWQKESVERTAREEAREEKEARRPWAARKWRRGVRKAREVRERWMEGVEGLQERLRWEW